MDQESLIKVWSFIIVCIKNVDNISRVIIRSLNEYQALIYQFNLDIDDLTFICQIINFTSKRSMTTIFRDLWSF